MRAPALDAAVVAAYPAYHHLASVAGRDDRNKLRVLLLAGRVDREETEEHYAQDEEQDEWILLKAKRTTKGDYTLGAPASLACLDSAQLDSVRIPIWRASFVSSGGCYTGIVHADTFVVFCVYSRPQCVFSLIPMRRIRSTGQQTRLSKPLALFVRSIGTCCFRPRSHRGRIG